MTQPLFLNQARIFLTPLLLLGCGHLGVDLDNRPVGADGPDASLDGKTPGQQKPGEEPPLETDASARPGSKGPDAGDAGDAGSHELDGGSVGLDSGPPTDGGDDVPDSGPDPALCTESESCCVAETACDLSCQSAPCRSRCERGSECLVDAEDSPQVAIDCAVGATCRATDAEAAEVAFTCEGGGDCYASCGNAESCSIDCKGTGKCTLDCANAVHCRLTCANTSRCYLQHDDQDTEVVAECLTKQECGEALLACNAPCPVSDNADPAL